MLLIALPWRLLMVSLPGKNKIFCLSFILFPYTNPQDKICHMVASEHPEVIEGRRRLIYTDVIDSEKAAEDGSIDNYGADFYEEDDSGLGDVGVIKDVTQSGT